MKLKALLFLLMILPVLITGLNFQKFYNPLIRNDNSVLQKQFVPSINQARDRNWHLAGWEYQDDGDENGVLDHNKLHQYFYNDVMPEQIDSIWVLHWVPDFENWGYEYTRKFVYDTSGEYVTQVQYYINIYMIPFILIDCVYDAQNRLTDTYFQTLDQVNMVYNLHQRVNFVYGTNTLDQKMNIYPGISRAYYEKYTFDHDTMGRNVTIYCTAGPDSVIWGNLSQENIVYHDNDTTTGLDYVNYLSHNHMFEEEWTGLYGMISSYAYYYNWNTIGGWDDSSYDTYIYNTNSVLTAIITRHFDMVYINDLMTVFIYDANNNLDYCEIQPWDSGSSVWGLPNEKYIYSWVQFTANEDDTITPVPMSLSVYPNPFNDKMNIRLESKDNTPVETSVYNIKGQLIKSLGKSKDITITWDGKDNQGRDVSNGIYFIKATQDGKSASKKIIRIN